MHARGELEYWKPISHFRYATYWSLWLKRNRSPPCLIIQMIVAVIMRLNTQDAHPVLIRIAKLLKESPSGSSME